MFKKELRAAKSEFYKKKFSELKTKKPGQWYSSLKRLTSYGEGEREGWCQNIFGG